MEADRTKNALRNVLYAIILRLYQLVIPFLIRTVLIYKFGLEYVGLSSLFTSILGILNLAELGFGSALVFSLYRPIAEQDTVLICALMNFYKKCYRIIGTIIMAMGVLVTPFIPRMVNSELPDAVNLYVLYFIQLASTVVTYFMFAYKNCLLVAYQRNDINSKVSLVTYTIQYILQIIALIIFAEYYLYVIVVPLTNIASNIITAIIATKTYPQYSAQGKLPETKKYVIIEKVKALFTVKIGNVVLYAADNIVISAFGTLTLLGKYNNYYYIVSSLVSIVGMLTSSIVSVLGNSLVVESVDKNYKDFKRLSFMNLWLVGWFSTCLVCLYQPFMKIWVGENNMLSFTMVILFGIYFYMLQSMQVAGAYKDAAGIWWEDKYRPLITAIANLVLNLGLFQVIGLYGIVISTIFSLLFINMPWFIHNVYKLIFHRSEKEFFLMWGKNVFFTIVITIICIFMCRFVQIEGFWELIFRGIICLVIPNLLYFLFYRKTSDFVNSMQWIKLLIKRLKNATELKDKEMINE